jgi:uncharacterized damage-inducible protein DinB
MNTKTIDRSIISLKEIFELHTRLFLNVVDGIKESDAQQTLNKSTNHIAWLTGHVVSSRHAIANIIGGNNKESYPELFGQGKGIESITYPSLEDLVADWDSTSEVLISLLDDLSDNQLQEEAPIKVPLGDGSLRSLIAFFVHHEAYHIGQLGIARKYFGYDSMKYN